MARTPLLIFFLAHIYPAVIATLGVFPLMCPIIMAICSMGHPLRDRRVANVRLPVYVDTHLYFGSVTKLKELDADGLVDLYVLMDVVEETAGGINKENLYDTAVAAGTK